MNKWLKYLLVALVIIYIVSPVDLIPGPLDDLMLAAGLIYKLLSSHSLPEAKPRSPKPKKTRSQPKTKEKLDDQFIFDEAEVVEGEIVEEIPK